MVGANAGAASGGARVAQLRCGARKGMEGKDGAGRFEGVRENTSNAQTSRIAGIADAWRCSPAASGGMDVGGVTVETLSLQ